MYDFDDELALLSDDDEFDSDSTNSAPASLSVSEEISLLNLVLFLYDILFKRMEVS